MVSLEHHHRRIRRKARVAHWTLLPLALTVPAAWLYWAVSRCQEAETAGDAAVCRAFSLVPLLPAALALLLGGLIALDLAALTREHGRGALDHHHRRHVGRAALEIACVVLGLAAWLAYEWYTTTH